MQFSYKAMDANGAEQKGFLDAETPTVAMAQLAHKGLTAFELVQIHHSEFSSKGKSRGLKRREGSPRSAVVLLVRELASLLQAGVTLEESLRTLLDGQRGLQLEAPLSAVLTAVLSGERFSSALRANASDKGLAIPAFLIALVTAGESTGDLAAALTRGADQLEFDEQIRAETSEALVYPLILIAAGTAAVLFVFSFVVPRFSSLLAGKKADLPWLSSAVLNTGEFVNQHGFSLLIAVAVLAAAGMGLLRTLGPHRVRSLIARLPVLGTWLQQQELSRWTGMLALMLQSRVPILTALELTAGAVSLPEIAERLRRTVGDIGRGETLSHSLSEQALLHASALSMVRVGERTGQLGQMMGHVAAYTLEQNRRQRRQLVALIEPAAIVVLGGIIALIIVGVVLALTSLSEVKF